jgi:3-oxoacyl-[acyl-carrier-protein] synthase-3
MASRVRVGIAGTGSYVPERVVPNEEFEKFLDTSNEWIVQRTGIRERRFVADGESTSDMCVAAGHKALAAAGISPDELDMIIVGTLTPDQPLPSTACLVQDRLGASRAGAFDCAAACTGFITALSIGESFVAAGRARRVLVLGAEVLSRYLDFTDRTSCILFGDAAGAAVVMPHDECGQGEILNSVLGADGSGFDFIHIPGGGSANPASHQTVDNGDHYIHLRGREVFRFAVKHMSELIRQMLEGYDPDELGLIIPHQVNRRIIDAALERLGMTDEKVVVNIQHYANTSAATVPVALDEAVQQGRLEKGKLVVLVAFGAGLTWGASLVRW